MNAMASKKIFGLLLATVTSPVLAHHSHAMFDHTKTVTVTGKISEVSYRNPHVFLWIDVEADGGEIQTWSVEMSNIQIMIRRGIGGGTFTIGEQVVVTMNPLINGNLGGNYVSIIDSDGMEYD